MARSDLHRVVPHKVKFAKRPPIDEDRSMLFLILAGVALLAVGLLVRSRREDKPRGVADLGTISQGWIANHRASSYETNR